jgi:hypothetical protein
MTEYWWIDWLIGIVGGLILAWLILVIALVVVRPRGGMLREAMRLLPDVIRLIHRLAADRTLPRGVRIRAVPPAWTDARRFGSYRRLLTRSVDTRDDGDTGSLSPAAPA